ncbi:MAG: hypothetical protein QUU85_04260, partial [Candidatus Eisenbacteria bacterium]|nr:hypothetical protein [Candidatus Eisenbacteria bacterium]
RNSSAASDVYKRQVDTLRALREETGAEIDLWLLLGEDSLRELGTWRSPGEITRLAGIGVYGRPGSLPARADTMPAGARIRWIDGPLCGLSSTWIRSRLRLGLSVAEMVPAEILPFLGPGSPYTDGPGETDSPAAGRGDEGSSDA